MVTNADLKHFATFDDRSTIFSNCPENHAHADKAGKDRHQELPRTGEDRIIEHPDRDAKAVILVVGAGDAANGDRSRIVPGIQDDSCENDDVVVNGKNVPQSARSQP